MGQVFGNFLPGEGPYHDYYSGISYSFDLVKRE